MKANLQLQVNHDNIPGRPSKYKVQWAAIRGSVSLLGTSLILFFFFFAYPIPALAPGPELEVQKTYSEEVAKKMYNRESIATRPFVANFFHSWLTFAPCNAPQV